MDTNVNLEFDHNKEWRVKVMGDLSIFSPEDLNDALIADGRDVHPIGYSTGYHGRGKYFFYDKQWRHYMFLHPFPTQEEAEQFSKIVQCVVERIVGSSRAKKLRRRIEDALRKTATENDLVAIAEMLGVKTE